MRQILPSLPAYWYDSSEDDATLIQAARIEPAAFSALYLRYRHRVYVYLRSRTGNEEDAADLTQVVFMHALQGLPRYRGRDSEFRAWLFRIARNAAHDFHRAQRNTVPWDLLPEALHPEADADVEAAVLRQEDIQRLREALLTLDRDTRELLALRFGGGLTAAECGAAIGASEAATRKRLQRTFKRLKERYDESP